MAENFGHGWEDQDAKYNRILAEYTQEVENLNRLLQLEREDHINRLAAIDAQIRISGELEQLRKEALALDATAPKEKLDELSAKIDALYVKFETLSTEYLGVAGDAQGTSALVKASFEKVQKLKSHLDRL